MCTTPTSALEAHICFTPMELVVHSEARSTALRLCSLGSWSYLHPKQGHSSVLFQLQQSDPIFNMGVDALRSVFNFEPTYRVTVD
jgi:hypothetical protein